MPSGAQVRILFAASFFWCIWRVVTDDVGAKMSFLDFAAKLYGNVAFSRGNDTQQFVGVCCFDLLKQGID